MHHRYGPFKTNIHPKVLRMLIFFIIPIEMIYETNIVDIFLNVNVLTNSFFIKVSVCTFWKLQILFFYLLYGSSC